MRKRTYRTPSVMVVSVENGCLMTSGDDPTDESKNPLENGGSGNPGDYNISSKENIEEW